MAPKTKNQPLDQDKALAGVLALLVAQREEQLGAEGAEERKTEVILASAGLQANEIAPLVGKNYDAVKKTIQRGRQGPKKKAPSKGS
jgi:DNA-directed RNA polymerase specialized sigma24 family protein